MPSTRAHGTKCLGCRPRTASGLSFYLLFPPDRIDFGILSKRWGGVIEGTTAAPRRRKKRCLKASLPLGRTTRVSTGPKLPGLTGMQSSMSQTPPVAASPHEKLRTMTRVTHRRMPPPSLGGSSPRSWCSSPQDRATGVSQPPSPALEQARHSPQVAAGEGER
jgi:hypothetical protein